MFKFDFAIQKICWIYRMVLEASTASVCALKMLDQSSWLLLATHCIKQSVTCVIRLPLKYGSVVYQKAKISNISRAVSMNVYVSAFLFWGWVCKAYYLHYVYAYNCQYLLILNASIQLPCHLRPANILTACC